MLLIERAGLDLLLWVIGYFIIGITVIITDGLGTSSSLILMIQWSCVAIRSHCRDSILDVETGMLELLGQIPQVACITINVVHGWQAAILKVQIISILGTLLPYHSVITFIWPNESVRLKDPADSKRVRLLSLPVCQSVISKELALSENHGVIISSFRSFIDLLKHNSSAPLSLQERVAILWWIYGMHLTALGVMHNYIPLIRIADRGPSRRYFLFLLKHWWLWIARKLWPIGPF